MINEIQMFRELDTIKAGITGVNARLDTLNGRTRVVENKVGIIWWGLAAAITIATTLIGWIL